MEPFMLHGRHAGGPMFKVEKPRGITRLQRSEGRGHGFDPCIGNMTVCDRACFERPCGQDTEGKRFY